MSELEQQKVTIKHAGDCTSEDYVLWPKILEAVCSYEMAMHYKK